MDIRYTVASDREKLKQAFELIYDSYLAANLCTANSTGMKIIPHQLLDTSQVFVAVDNDTNKVVYTLTLIIDSFYGLPMESIYSSAINKLRKQKRICAEVSCLAHDKNYRSLKIMIQLFRLMGQFARQNGVDDLVIVVHPKHARFYQDYICFENMSNGDVKEYPSVENKLAIPLRLQLQGEQFLNNKNYHIFFGDLIPHAELVQRPLSSSDVSYFSDKITEEKK